MPALLSGDERRLTVRTRLVVGDRDPIVRSADLRGFEEHPADMAVEWVAGAGHFLPEERPDLVVDRVREICGV